MMLDQETRTVTQVERRQTETGLRTEYVPYSHSDFSALFRAMERRAPETFEQLINPEGGFFNTRDMASVMNAVHAPELGAQPQSVEVVSEQLGMSPEHAVRNLAKAISLEAWARTDQFASKILEARAFRAQNRE